MILLIHASARPAGTSRMLAGYFSARLPDSRTVQLLPNGGNTEEVLEAVQSSEAIVLIGPCYLNTWPAEVIGFLTRAKNAEVFWEKTVYGFIQGGMPYPHTHEPALRTLQFFCEDAGAHYLGGFVMGGGAILDGRDLSQIVGAKTMVPAVDAFIARVRQRTEAPANLYKEAAMPMPAPVVHLLSFFMNRSLKKQMRDLGIDPKTPSPHQPK